MNQPALSPPFHCAYPNGTKSDKPGVEMEDVEMAPGEMCNVVKNTCGGDKGGFIAGQVYQLSGFVSDEGSQPAASHVAIVTYWHSFEEHEKSHADKAQG